MFHGRSEWTVDVLDKSIYCARLRMPGSRSLNLSGVDCILDRSDARWMEWGTTVLNKH